MLVIKTYMVYAALYVFSRIFCKKSDIIIKVYYFKKFDLVKWWKIKIRNYSRAPPKPESHPMTARYFKKGHLVPNKLWSHLTAWLQRNSKIWKSNISSNTKLIWIILVADWAVSEYDSFLSGKIHTHWVIFFYLNSEI